jgi:hypothetical protein
VRLCMWARLAPDRHQHSQPASGAAALSRLDSSAPTASAGVVKASWSSPLPHRGGGVR